MLLDLLMLTTVLVNQTISNKTKNMKCVCLTIKQHTLYTTMLCRRATYDLLTAYFQHCVQFACSLEKNVGNTCTCTCTFF